MPGSSLMTFFFESTGELCFIALERKKGPHTISPSHTGTKYEKRETHFKGNSSLASLKMAGCVALP